MIASFQRNVCTLEELCRESETEQSQMMSHIWVGTLHFSCVLLSLSLLAEPGLCLQLALKQLSPGVRVEPCGSAVLQFSVEEIGQLVPLLPNPCTPISPTRWQTEDLDGNKVLFQVSTA